MLAALGVWSVAEGASAQDPGVVITGLTHEGPLCPPGSLPSWDEVAFDDSIRIPLDVRVESTTLRVEKWCRVTLSLEIPEGYQFRRTDLFVEHRARLDRSSARVSLSYGYEGREVENSLSNYVHSDGEHANSLHAVGLEWSPSCGATRTLRYQVRVSAEVSPNIAVTDGSARLDVGSLLIDFPRSPSRRCDAAPLETLPAQP